MKYVLTNDKGVKISLPTEDRKAIRRLARDHQRAGQRIMIFITNEAGDLLTYAISDMEAIARA